GAEPQPQRFGSALLDRADRLPLVLETLDLASGAVPVVRLGERLGLHDERFLLGEVLGPDDLARREIGVAPCEEAIAGGAEALPDGLLLAAADRTDRLPLRLQRLDGLRGLDPAGRVGERLGTLAQADLPRQVLPARLVLGGEVRLA